MKINNGRAWAEIDLSAIRHNARLFSEMVGKDCKVVPVVKANAYGHGDIEVTKALNEIGYDFFAVATAHEGQRLRVNGITGEILILGYTALQDLEIVVANDLIQTVLCEDYAEMLESFGKPVRAHIKIDTGMHRIGFDFSDIEHIERIYKSNVIKAEGIYTHLCASDSPEQSDIDFTNLQKDKYFSVVNALREKGINVGLTHIQASYGMMNYPEIKADMARLGITLYGVLSDMNNTLRYEKPDIHPALSLKARISMVKDLQKGETVSYGRLFTADKNMKVATVSIGYADGIPRDYAQRGAFVLVNGHKAAVIGRVCMDQFIIDVTDAGEVKQDDVAVIIGKDGDAGISVEEVAQRCGTISYELFVRLNCRVDYVYINK